MAPSNVSIDERRDGLCFAYARAVAAAVLECWIKDDRLSPCPLFLDPPSPLSVCFASLRRPLLEDAISLQDNDSTRPTSAMSSPDVASETLVPAVDLVKAARAAESNSDWLIAVVSVVWGCAFLTASARFYTRVFLVRSCGKDDIFMAFSVVRLALDNDGEAFELMIVPVMWDRGFSLVDRLLQARIWSTSGHDTARSVLRSSRGPVLPVGSRSVVRLWLPQGIHRAVVAEAQQRGHVVQVDIMGADR